MQKKKTQRTKTATPKAKTKAKTKTTAVKRKLSAEGRAAISASSKRRWRAWRREKKAAGA